jgi:hypothetical protein
MADDPSGDGDAAAQGDAPPHSHTSTLLLTIAAATWASNPTPPTSSWSAPIPAGATEDRLERV